MRMVFKRVEWKNIKREWIEYQPDGGIEATLIELLNDIEHIHDVVCMYETEGTIEACIEYGNLLEALEQEFHAMLA